MHSFLAEQLPGTEFRHYSAALGREKVARVLMPPGPPPDQGWRTCYLLHAFGGNRLSWLRCLNLSSILERDPGLLLIFPESGRRWFINDALGNRYEDYLVDDLVPAIDEAFHTNQSARCRSIGGFSMGGAAAVSLSLLYPNLFPASFAYAGAFYASRREGDPYAAHRANGCLMPTESEHERVWGAVGSDVRRMYDPDELIKSALMIGVSPKIMLEVGVNDYERVVAQNRKLHQALEDAGLKHIYAEYPGDHTWPFAAASAERAFLRLAANGNRCG